MSKISIPPFWQFLYEIQWNIFEKLSILKWNFQSFRPFRGITAVVAGAGPAHAFYFATYEHSKKVMSNIFPQYEHLNYGSWCIKCVRQWISYWISNCFFFSRFRGNRDIDSWCNIKPHGSNKTTITDVQFTLQNGFAVCSWCLPHWGI